MDAEVQAVAQRLVAAVERHDDKQTADAVNTAQICLDAKSTGSFYRNLIKVLAEKLHQSHVDGVARLIQMCSENNSSLVLSLVLKSVRAAGSLTLVEPYHIIDHLKRVIHVVESNSQPALMAAMLEAFRLPPTVATDGVDDSIARHAAQCLHEYLLLQSAKHPTASLQCAVACGQLKPLISLCTDTTMHIFMAAVKSGQLSIAEEVCDLLFEGPERKAAWEAIMVEAERRNKRAIHIRASRKVLPPGHSGASAATATTTALLPMTSSSNWPSGRVGGAGGIEATQVAAIAMLSQWPTTQFQVDATAGAMADIIAKSHKRAPADDALLHSSDVPADYWQRSVMHLVHFGRLDVAATYVGSDAAMQQYLLELLISLSRFSEAMQLKDAFLEAYEGSGSNAAVELRNLVASGAAMVAQLDKYKAEPQSQLTASGGVAAENPLSSLPILHQREAAARSHFFEWPIAHCPSAAGADGSGLVYVSTIEGVHAMVHFFQRLPIATPIGFDAEWRPDRWNRARNASSTKLPQQWPVSVIQVACINQTFIVDLLLLVELRSSATHVVDSVMQEMFRTLTERHFVGFGVDQDLARLASSYPMWFTHAHSPVLFIELALVVQEVYRLCGSAFDGVSGCWPASVCRSGSLSALVGDVLGFPLDKTEQTSDWQRRPLNQRQIIYAAYDAIVSAVVYEVCKSVVTLAYGTDAFAADVLQLCSQQFDVLAIGHHDLPIQSDITYKPIWAETMPGIRPLDGMREGDLGPGKVAAILALHGYTATDHMIEVADGFSAVDAAASIGVDVARIIKTLAIFINSDVPALLLLRGSDKVDMSKLAAACGCSRSGVRFASAAECLTVFGYAPGSFPPFGHRDHFKTFVDSAVCTNFSEYEEIYAGGGSETMLLKLPRAALVHIAEAQIADVACGTNSTRLVDAASRDTATERGRWTIPRPRFLVDTMLGRLTRWLRVIGVDAESPQMDGKSHNSPTADVLIELANSTGRILLTRDRKLLQKRDVCAMLYAPFNDTPRQFEYIATHFRLRVKPEDLMSRCAKCNGLGYERLDVDTARAVGGVPDKVLAAVNDYWRCRRCGKLYWEGSKFSDVQTKFASMFGHDSPAVQPSIQEEDVDFASVHSQCHVREEGDKV